MVFEILKRVKTLIFYFDTLDFYIQKQSQLQFFTKNDIKLLIVFYLCYTQNFFYTALSVNEIPSPNAFKFNLITK